MKGYHIVNVIWFYVMKNKIKFVAVMKQIMVILILPIMFVWTSYRYFYDQIPVMPQMVGFTIILTGIFIVMVLYLLSDWIKNSQKIMLKKYYTIMLLCFFSTLILLPTLDELPRWDGIIYYSNLEKMCEKFDFTIDGILNGFRGGHSSQGYMMFLAIGYYIFTDHLFGTLVMQMLLYVVMALSYYGVLQEIFPFQKHTTYFWGTTIFTMAPLVYGIEPILSPDYGVLCYLILFVYVALKKKLLLEWWCALLLSMSKPHGVLYYTVFYAVVFFVREYRFIKEHKKIDTEQIKSTLARTIPGFLYIIYYFVSDYSITSFSSGMNSVDLGTERLKQGLGINWEYILVKLKEIFLLNFTWVFYAILLGGMVIFLFNRKEKLRIREELYGIIGVGISFLIVNCVYITYAHPRYLSVGTFVVSILAFGVLIRIIKSKNILTFILVMLTQLNTLASYSSVDPVSHGVFDSFSVGKSEMYVLIYDDIRMYPSDIYSDATLYNRQFVYYTKLLEKMLDETGYNGTVPILLVDMSKGQWEQGMYDYINTMLEGMYGRKTLYWNAEEKRLDMNSDNIKMNVVYFSSEQILNGSTNAKAESLPKEAIFVHLPRQGTELIDIISNLYNVEATYNIEDHEMSLMAYRIKMK